MNAKEFLNRAYNLDKLIESNLMELKELTELAECISAVNYSAKKVQTSPVIHDNMAEQSVRIIDLKDKINSETDSYVNLKNEIRDKIMLIDAKDERLILKYRFIHFMKFEEIAEKMNYNIRQIFRIYKRALKNFEKIMDK